MPRRTKITADAESLRNDFHQFYGSGQDFEGATLIEIVIRASDLLEEIVGSEATTAAFAELTRKLGYKVADPAGWADALRDEAFGDAYCWPMGERLHDLNAYAYYGIALNGGRIAAERESMLRVQIEAVSAFMAKVSFDAWGVDPGDAARTLLRAQARFALDTGEPIEPSALALLAGLGERRIRNMMAGKERAFSSEDGKIPAAEALVWLAHRPEVFRPSRWRDQNTFEDLPAPPPEIGDIVFVPASADGSIFHPGLIRDGVYAVGRGSLESRHATFEAALTALQKLSDAAWARPTALGTWTTVAAARWLRMSRTELDRLAEAA